MAQWSRKDRTLYTKLVYYGPAFGGKTTNLQSLHRITDPRGQHKLLSVKTADDRTLFFDLLPFDLGDILGYQVAMKLYTVPGQVRYDTTRQVVLAGADAVVFVADSTAGREDQNVWSLQNLQMNMRAKRLDPARVPVLFQFNKQDLPDEAAPPEEVAAMARAAIRGRRDPRPSPPTGTACWRRSWRPAGRCSNGWWRTPTSGRARRSTPTSSDDRSIGPSRPISSAARRAAVAAAANQRPARRRRRRSCPRRATCWRAPSRPAWSWAGGSVDREPPGRHASSGRPRPIDA